MKSLKHFLLLFAATALTTTVHAQILMGDMNHSGNLDVEDITLLIDGYLTDQEVWIEGHEYVDLGLSVYWATVNIGANAPEEYGDYFAWGETTTKDTYTWENYNWCKGSENTMTKYCTDSSYGTVDNKTVLEPEDDAAHVNWGGTWRMPTYDEYRELVDKCTWAGTTQNDVEGLLVTGPNGNSIFLPGAGFFGESPVATGYYGNYWSSSLDTDHPFYARSVYFYSSIVGWGTGDYRCSGRSVRAVYPKKTIQPEISLSETYLELKAEESVQLTAIVEPSDAGTVTWTSSDESVATVADGFVTAISEGTATITAEVGGAEATCEVTVMQEHEYVDLGLSVKWATMNIGANSPEEYGDYFAWGETTPKDTYTWENYKWCKGSEDTMTKYCTDSDYGTVDNKTVLEPEDDAAHVNWGGTWRMPTYDEYRELVDKCTWAGTTQNDVEGLLVTGPNGNSIFLPGAGFFGESPVATGYYGNYWSSSLDTDSPFYARSVYFYSSNVGWGTGDYRCSGRSIRAVCPKKTIQPEISLSETYLELKAEESVQLTAIVEPSDAGTVTWTSSDESVATVVDGLVTAIAEGTATITAEVEGTEATCEVTVMSSGNESEEHEFVDLGLSVKWATMNIGANVPEEYGDYFAWGETKPKSTYTWSTYKWCKGSYTTMTKYCTKSNYGTVDNKSVLELEDDAAHVNWGGTWRMPTRAEIEELLGKCTWTWTTQNGVNGYLVTGPNGASVFLPAAGYRDDSSLYDAGSDGYYWSSSLYPDDDYYAFDLFFGSGYTGWGSSGRFGGHSVRAVCP